jgi:hypothetical protein
MSEFRDIHRAIVTDREPGTVENCVNLDTGSGFLAEVAEIQDIELNEALGRDPREQIMIYVSDRTAAAAIKLGGKVQISLYGINQKFLVVRRKDNPSSPQVEFGLAKLVSGKDKD